MATRRSDHVSDKTHASNAWKIWAARRGVQLIVFFAAIREILKKEIYRTDKQGFCVMKTKGELVGSGKPARGITNRADLVCE